MRIQHWQDAASLLLGVWLVVSPFVLGFAGADVWITIVLGLCVIVAAVEGFVLPSYLEEWAEILFGLALVRPGSGDGALDGRLRVRIGHGKQRGVRHSGDPACDLGAADRSRFHHLVARSLAPPSELRRGVVVPTLPSGPVGDRRRGSKVASWRRALRLCAGGDVVTTRFEALSVPRC
jgi:hypothetical protein